MELWADLTRSTPEAATPGALAHARTASVTTVLLRPDQLAGWEPLERIDVPGIRGQVLARSLIEIGQNVGFPIVPNARPNCRYVGGGEHEQHIEHFRRADFHSKTDYYLIVAGIPPKCQVRHREVLMYQELERFGFAER